MGPQEKMPIVAIGVSAATGVVALIALVTGMVALGRSDQAQQSAQAAAERTLPAPTIVAQQSIAPEPTDTAEPTGAAGSPNPVVYENQQLKLQNACVGSGQAVDLDEPRVAPPDGADLTFFACTDTRFTFEGTTSFAEVTDPQATPATCLDALRTNPGVESLRVARGQTVCVLTTGNAPKLVRVHTDAATDRVALTLTAWTAP
ncbi:hypothetical protein [Cryptosporangium sp. NPDC048952]|uniref:hypothetical protein n=1 Tax=Cryptosporangium sp. NPDC048952 TaxID=3363961 RepID=UPI00371E3B46